MKYFIRVLLAAAAVPVFCGLTLAQSSVTKVELFRPGAATPFETLTSDDSNFTPQASDSTGDGLADSITIQAWNKAGLEIGFEINCSSRQLSTNLPVGYYSPVTPFVFGQSQPGLLEIDVVVNGVVLNGVSTATLLAADFDYSGGQITIKSFAANFTGSDGQPVIGTIYYQFVDPPTPVVIYPSAISPASIEANHPLSATLLAIYGSGTYTWQVSGGVLPPGLSLSADGQITGAPTQPGNYNFTVSATDTHGQSGTHNYSLQVLTQVTRPPVTMAQITGDPGDFLTKGNSYLLNQGKAVVTASANDGTAGEISLRYTDGTNTFIFDIRTSGAQRFNNALVPGFYPYTGTAIFDEPYIDIMSLLPSDNSECDEDSGSFTIIDAKFDYSNPNNISVISFAAKIVNYCGTSEIFPQQKLTATLFYNYQEPFKLQMTTPSGLPDATTGLSYKAGLIAHGGQEPYSFMLTGGDLPTATSLDTTGIISGPTLSSGVFNFTAKVTDANGQSDERSFTLPVFDPLKVSMPAKMPDGAIGKPYSFPVTITGGAAPYSIGGFGLGFLLFGPGDLTDLNVFLPNGLHFDGSTISGVPTSAGTYLIPIFVFDKFNRLAWAHITLTIDSNGPPIYRQFSATTDNTTIDSDPNYFFGPESGLLTAFNTTTPSVGVTSVTIDIVSNFYSDLSNYFQMTFGTGGLKKPLTGGTYQVTGSVSHPEAAYMDIRGTLTYCSDQFGSFTVLDAQYDFSVSPAKVISFAVDFDVACAVGAPAFRGKILYNTTVAPSGTAPVITGVSYSETTGNLIVRGTGLASSALNFEGFSVDSDPIISNGAVVGRTIQAFLFPGKFSIRAGNGDGLVSNTVEVDVKLPAGKLPSPTKPRRGPAAVRR